jgi:hypothetical protein
MKLLTIYTELYENKLRSFLDGASVTIRSQGYAGPLYYARCAYESKDMRFFDAFIYFLEEVILDENPIYRSSIKLREAAEGMRGMSAQDFYTYIKQNKTVHIEGYTVFRMADYKYKLDMMMIGMIKKLKI